jgi:ferric-dicitrate binding protein FerR (iron transport regulator)
MVNQDRLLYLLEQVRIREVTAEECEELISLVETDQSGELIHRIDAFYEDKGFSEPAVPYNFPYWQAAVREILDADKTEGNHLKDKDYPEHTLYKSPEVSSFLQRKTWRWVAAAVFTGLIACGAYIFYNTGKPVLPVTVTRGNDLPPGNNKAVLTLANGQQVILDNSNKGTIASQGNVQVIKLGSGLLAYNKTAKGTEQVLYNSITTPRGGQYQLILPDGTHVWLNAASSLRFPTVFAGKQREVALSGEAYFEVTHITADGKYNSSAGENQRYSMAGGPRVSGFQPFIVKVKNNMEVKVLGTHFNVMAYDEEPSIQTTLAEGSVQVSNVTGSVLIRPGQQASLVKSGNQRFTVSKANLEEVLAWKNGQLLLSNVSVPAIMRQISRWYDVAVSYSGNIPDKSFNGLIDRNVPLSDVLKVLEVYDLHCRLEPGKKLVVLP